MQIENPELPLVTAVGILPGGHDPSQLIACFQAQTYPNKELVIVHNGTDLQAAGLAVQRAPDVRIVDTGGNLSAGMCRNYGLSAANGKLAAHFDPDCWHHPKRIESQVAVLVKHQAHAVLLTSIIEYSYASGYAGYLTNPKGIVPGSILFARQPHYSYPDSNRLEELGLLTGMVNSGARPISVERPHLMIKLHGGGEVTEPRNLPGRAALSEEHLELVRGVLAGAY